jgi:hypothetical protein
MKLSPYYEVNSFYFIEEIPKSCIEEEGSLPYSQGPSTDPYPEPD